MQVEENLIIASRRGESRRLRWAFSSGDHEKFRDMVARLGLGLEDRLSTRIGLLSGGQRQALTLLMATLKSRIFFFWMNLPQPWIRRLQAKC